ncbi:FTR1 family iron permease [Siculibacillus lacustris]|uniref:FTR1 family iron permease n=1 Tax=Siculibacillus lacustris TaxID=1549641 RepID=A0A4Q9VQG3_9HYPH|nr:FTR1 family iron permease [Siculibacillus lacustris]
MGGQFGQIAFIVWRESVEALLVVGILNAWLAREGAVRGLAGGRAWLWGGVGAGLAVAAALAVALLFFAEAFGDEGQDWFQIVMVFLAAGLILQMVAWMRRHGRNLKRNLESGLSAASARASGWGVFVLATVAVAREGSETVVFLWGTFATMSGSALVAPIAAALGGLLAAVATYGLLQLGGRVLSWRTFFQATEIMLLFLALAMLTTGVDRLIGLDLLPTLSKPLWSTAWLLDDGTFVGGFVAALTGYRARPDLTTLLLWVSYGLLVWRLVTPPKAITLPVREVRS